MGHVSEAAKQGEEILCLFPLEWQCVYIFNFGGKIRWQFTYFLKVFQKLVKQVSSQSEESCLICMAGFLLSSDHWKIEMQKHCLDLSEIERRTISLFFFLMENVQFDQCFSVMFNFFPQSPKD